MFSSFKLDIRVHVFCQKGNSKIVAVMLKAKIEPNKHPAFGALMRVFKTRHCIKIHVASDYNY